MLKHLVCILFVCIANFSICYAGVYHSDTSRNDNYISNDDYHGNVKYQLENVKLSDGEIFVHFKITNLWPNRESILIFGKDCGGTDNRLFREYYARPFIYQPNGDHLNPERNHIPAEKRLCSSSPEIMGDLASFQREFKSTQYGGDTTVKVVLPPGSTISGYVTFPTSISKDKKFYVVIPNVNGWGRTIVFKNIRLDKLR